MVLLEQKIKIIQWREKLDMQMRAGSEFTNMCRVKSKNPQALNFFSTQVAALNVGSAHR